MILIQIGIYLKEKFHVYLGTYKPNKIPKHRLIWWRNVASLTFIVFICFVMAPKSRYLKSVSHKIVMWNTNRPRRLYFTMFFNLLFLHVYSPIFSLNCICCHLFSADNISVFTYTFIHVIYIKSYILPKNISAKNLKIV